MRFLCELIYWKVKILVKIDNLDYLVVGLASFRPRFAGKCGRQSRDLTQSHQSY